MTTLIKVLGNHKQLLRTILLLTAMLAGFVFVLCPLLRVLSLDFRALMATLRTSQYELITIEDAWIERGTAAIRYGPLPLMTVLALWVTSGSHTLAGLKRWHKVLVFIVSIVPFIAFAIPAALALSVWIIVETYAWIEWSVDNDYLAERVITVTAPIIAVNIVAIGSICLFAALRRERGRWRRVIAFAMLPVALVSVPVWIVIGLHGAGVLPVMSKVFMFEKRCSGCHVPEAPLAYVKTPYDWKTYLDATCFRRSQEAPDTQWQMDAGVRGLTRRWGALEYGHEDDVIEFLNGMRSYSDVWVFTTRCRRCHVLSDLWWEDRSPKDWERIVDRVATYSLLYYSPSIRKQIVRYLSEHHGSEGVDTPALKVVRACSTCHFASRNADENRSLSDEAIRRIVRRMLEKSGDVDDLTLKELSQGYHELLSDEMLFKRLAPHDRPVMEQVLAW